MKRVFSVVGMVLLLFTSLQAAEWEIDKPHSNLNFKVSHLVISNVTGKFGGFSGDINFDPDNLKEGSAELTIDVSTINTENEKRDGHLKSADFFDVEQFPAMTFKSTKVIPGEGKKFQVVGELTIKDVTREVTFDCTFNGTVDFMKTTKAGFTCTTTIDRENFNITWNQALETGGFLVGKEVEITLELELNKTS